MKESYGLVPRSPDKAKFIIIVGMYNLSKRNASLENSMLGPSFSGALFTHLLNLFEGIIQ